MGSSESTEPSRFFARFAALVTLAVGALVLAGWLFGIEQLTNLLPSWPRMAALTALTFIAAASALFLATGKAHRATGVVSIGIVAVGLAVLIFDTSGA